MKKIITFFATVLITASALAEGLEYQDEATCVQNGCQGLCIEKSTPIYACPEGLKISDDVHYENLSLPNNLYQCNSQCTSTLMCYGSIEEEVTDNTGTYKKTYTCSSLSKKFEWPNDALCSRDCYLCSTDIIVDVNDKECTSTGTEYISCKPDYILYNGKCYNKCDKGEYIDTGSNECVECGSYDGISLTSDGTGTDISSCYVDQEKTYSDGRGTYTISGNNGKCHLNLTTAK